jgi:hypothetical protein
MPLILATQLAAVGTAILAVFAIVTAGFAYLAFRKQSQEVRAIERQVRDQEELTRQQAELLKVQSGQLQLQRQANADRKREAGELRRAQASQVHLTLIEHCYDQRARTRREKANRNAYVVARIDNRSTAPIYSAELHWHQGSEPCRPVPPIGQLLSRHPPRAESHFEAGIPARRQYLRMRGRPHLPGRRRRQMDAQARRLCEPDSR